MKQNKIYITLAIIVIIAIVAFMAYDFFGGFEKNEKNVYEFNLDKLSKVDSSLVNYTQIKQFAPDIKKLRAITVDENDNIYLTGENKILIFNKNGNLLKDINTGIDALSMAVDTENNIYLGVRDHVEIWSENGQLINKWEVKNDRVVITSIAISENSVFVADAGNKIVYHYDLDGNYINEIGRKDLDKGVQGFVIPSPYFDLAIGRDDELWVVNSGRHQLESYDKNGNQKSSWKKTSMNIDGFSGCCNPSHIAILPNGSFVTSEKGIVRVKIHSPSGEFESVVASPDDFDKSTKGMDITVDSEERVIIIDPKRGLVRIFTKNIQ